MDGQYLRDEQGRVVLDAQSGLPVPAECSPQYLSSKRTDPYTEYSKVGGSASRRTPITSRFRKIGNPSPGWWNDIKTWWTALKPEYRYGALGGLVAIGVIVAAVQGKGKGSSVKKV